VFVREEGRCVVFDDYFEHEVWKEIDERAWCCSSMRMTTAQHRANQPHANAVPAASRLYW
jgi:hypothetical protein